MCRSRGRTAGVLCSLLLLFSDLDVSNGKRCSRVPSDRIPPTPSNGNYVIKFSGPGDRYRPGEQYNGKTSPLPAPPPTALCSFGRFPKSFARVRRVELAPRPETYDHFHRLLPDGRGEGRAAGVRRHNASNAPQFVNRFEANRVSLRSSTATSRDSSSWRRATRWPGWSAVTWW